MAKQPPAVTKSSMALRRLTVFPSCGVLPIRRPSDRACGRAAAAVRE
jgi:hypothetical protein